MSRVEFAQLLDWLEGRLNEGEAQAVAERVARADPATQADLAWLQALARIRQQIVLAAPPAAVHEDLMRQFQVARDAARPPGVFQRLAAVLAFDSRRLSLAPGLRSAGQPEFPQLVYSTGQADVVFNLAPRPDDQLLDVAGQVLPKGDRPPSGFVVQFLQAGTETAITPADDLGEFALAAVPPGAYEIVVSGEHLEITLADVHLSVEAKT